MKVKEIVKEVQDFLESIKQLDQEADVLGKTDMGGYTDCEQPLSSFGLSMEIPSEEDDGDGRAYLCVTIIEEE